MEEGEGEDKVLPGELIEVEAGEKHYGVVGVFLDGDHECRGLVPGDSPVVVGRPEGGEEGWGCGEDGEILDVWIVFL